MNRFVNHTPRSTAAQRPPIGPPGGPQSRHSTPGAKAASASQYYQEGAIRPAHPLQTSWMAARSCRKRGLPWGRLHHKDGGGYLGCGGGHDARSRAPREPPAAAIMEFMYARVALRWCGSGASCPPLRTRGRSWRRRCVGETAPLPSPSCLFLPLCFLNPWRVPVFR
jgi:hypothetical protein